MWKHNVLHNPLHSHHGEGELGFGSLATNSVSFSVYIQIIFLSLMKYIVSKILDDKYACLHDKCFLDLGGEE